MDLASQYEQQYRWRSWQQAYGPLPSLAGTRVLDLGCAIGEQSRDLAARGAQVVGIDGNEELLARARSRGVPGATFTRGDIRDPQVQAPFDGIWASFVAAYFPDLPAVLSKWRELLRPGGWIALTEVSGMFDHQPLSSGACDFLKKYAHDSRQAGRYDFDMGGKLADHLVTCGFQVRKVDILPDRELSFSGPADPDVLVAWEARLDRMRLMRERALDAGLQIKAELLDCLSARGHTTECRVHFCLARRE
ncbi:class I SAM-dependent methyltransferase [Ramlibacter rhizophilus]|nr:class I SAM-dependent methyltransferase [Ramlibacter rhizophilus]